MCVGPGTRRGGRSCCWSCRDQIPVRLPGSGTDTVGSAYRHLYQMGLSGSEKGNNSTFQPVYSISTHTHPFYFKQLNASFIGEVTGWTAGCDQSLVVVEHPRGHLSRQTGALCPRLAGPGSECSLPGGRSRSRFLIPRAHVASPALSPSLTSL